MRISRAILPAAALAAALSAPGCVMPDQMSQIQKDLADVKAELKRVQQEQAETRRRVEEVGGATLRTDDLATRAQVADLDSRVDQAARNAEINEERLSDIARQVDQLQREVDQARDLSRRALPPPGASGYPDEAPAAPRGPAATDSAGGPDPDELYNTAYADFSKGNYELAVSGFEEFYRTFPDSAVADNAQYWVGECYFSQGNFTEAIRAFDRMLEQFPKSDKAAAANLKKGLAYLEQNQVRQAIVQLQHVQSTYPGSDEARVARDKLTALGAPI